jgi:hypothetical protein
MTEYPGFSLDGLPSERVYPDPDIVRPMLESPLFTHRKLKSQYLSSGELMDQILAALREKRPLSVICMGDVESVVMAQYHLINETDIMNHPVVHVANRGERSGFWHRGIRFPNIEARDQAIEACRRADIVGYNTVIYNWEAGMLSEAVFDYNKITPRYVYEGYLRRVVMFTQRAKFEEMLRGRKILLVSSVADEARKGMEKHLQARLGFEVVGTVPIFEWEEIPDVKKQIEQYEFDLCLIAAGINAVILGPWIAETKRAVVFDIGFGINSFATNEVYLDGWLTDMIGLDRLMQM